MVGVTLGGCLAFSGLSIWNGNEKFFKEFVMPLTTRIDPETSHKLAVTAMKFCLIKKAAQPEPETLVTPC